MRRILTEPSSAAVPSTRADKLRRFISAYWLRPENAFWMVLRSDALSAVPMGGPSVDVSCGDGVFSFLHAGGRFDANFDVFATVDRLDDALSSSADIYDHVDDSYAPTVVTPPAYQFDYGSDCKRHSLTKASRLGFYRHLVPHDNNDPLPFASDHFETVYCNSAYWVDNIESFLSELGRITVPAGTIVLHVKLDAIKRFTLDRHRDVLGDRWLDIVNRDRFASWSSLCDRATWEDRFASAGLEILSAMPFATRTHAHLWDVGLRPIAPLLIKAMNSLHTHMRTEIKRDWVDLFCDLMRPFCDADVDLLGDTSQPVEMQYVLTPRDR